MVASTGLAKGVLGESVSQTDEKHKVRSAAQDGALRGIEVVEFGDGVAVGYLGALLAACGARVIKVEPPGRGDSVRHLPPFAEHAPAPEASGMHVFLNANKLSLALDVHDTLSKRRAFEIACKADVVIEAMGPGTMDALGLGHAELKAANPALTMVALSWFGATGQRRDWRGSDAIAQALSGFIYPIGPAEGPPVIPGGYNAQITAAVTAFIPLMAALLASLDATDGVLIDLSILEAQITYTETSGVRATYDGASTPRKGLNNFVPTYPQTIYPAADGWIGVTVLTPLQWRACCEMLGAPELVEDPRFRTSQDRSLRASELDPYLIPLFRRRPALEWFHEGQGRRIPLALVPTMADLRDLDHFEVREVLARFEHPDAGAFQAPAIPWKFAATPVLQGGRAPRLGEHSQALLRERSSATEQDLARLLAQTPA